jgi:hypothetical protein
MMTMTLRQRRRSAGTSFCPRPTSASARATGLAASLVLFAAARPALASENYPAIIDRQKGVECPRPLTRCLICHDSAAGGEGSANRPFALALKNDYGLSGGKEGRELAMAIEQLPDDVDTDGDGVPDQEELSLCMNPSGGELSEGPGFGCQLERFGAGSPLPWLAALMMAVAVRRRARLGAWRATSLLFVACTPTEISEQRFQSRAQTCYEFPTGSDAGSREDSTARFNTGLERRDGCETEPGIGGAGGRTGAPAPAAGGSMAGAAPTPAPSTAAGGGTAAGGNAAAGAPAVTPGVSPDAGSATMGGVVSEPSPYALPADCSEAAILEQFSRPYDMGGCTDPDGTGCHEDGTGEDPILQYPEDNLSRMLDQRDPEGCDEVWIPRGITRPDDSFLWRRLTQNVSDEDCEIQMPLDEDPLDPEVLACISAWIVWVANGRPQ